MPISLAEVVVLSEDQTKFPILRRCVDSIRFRECAAGFCEAPLPSVLYPRPTGVTHAFGFATFSSGRARSMRLPSPIRYLYDTPRAAYPFRPSLCWPLPARQRRFHGQPCAAYLHRSESSEGIPNPQRPSRPDECVPISHRSESAASESVRRVRPDFASSESAR